MQRIKVFTDRYPFLGPIIWILSVQYFIIQMIVASAWRSPGYSWRFNTISDLGNTACGLSSGRVVCSPLHGLMNLSFITLGVTIALGSLLIYQEFRESLGTLAGFSLMALAGLGTIIVGLFPENSVSLLHSIGASLPFILGNISLIVLAIYLYGIAKSMRIYTFLSGAVALVALVFFIGHHYGSFGIGGMERLVAYPQTVWLIVFGMYMMRSHYLQLRQAQKKSTEDL